MKLAVEINKSTLSNVGVSSDFKIKASAKAFSILSSGLYSNKKLAIIRELSCNAIDSHVAAGKQAVPFEVHLPSVFEPWFGVKDFGTGLDHEQVVNIYTTYFESTKTDSDEYIGALGLGSKSPFSYTENFTITAIKDGFKRIYSAYINEVGFPGIVEMSTELTDEVNGVEVKFSVTDRYDYHSFKLEARNVFKWFTHKPIITGDSDFKHDTVTFIDKDISPGIHCYARSGDCVALMGNIAYPIVISEPTKHFGDLAALLRCGLVIEFKIGELDFAASREQLSYVPLTINSIHKKLIELDKNLYGYVKNKADAIVGEWEKAEFLYTNATTPLFEVVTKKYVVDTKFPLFDAASYHCRKTFRFPEKDLEKMNMDITSLRVRNGTAIKSKRASVYTNGVHTIVVEIPVEKDVVIVLNDLKTGCTSRARFHYLKQNQLVTILSHSDKDLSVRQKAYDKFLLGLHNPPVVVKASSLDKPMKKVSVSSSGILDLFLEQGKRRGYQDSYNWRAVNGEIDNTVTQYYACLCNYTPMSLDNVQINLFHTKVLMDTCGVKAISDIQIKGVRKNKLRDIKGLSNWVWFEDKIKEEIAKIKPDYIESLVIANHINEYNMRVYTDAKIEKRISNTSIYSKFAKKYNSVKHLKGDISGLVALCALYGKVIDVNAIKKAIDIDKNLVIKRYPLLAYMQNSTIPDADVADYINLIDSNTNIV